MGENAILKERGQEQARKEQENNMKVIIILNQKMFWSCLRKNWNLGAHWRSNQKVTKCIKVGASKFFPLILESRTKSSLCKNRFLFFLLCPCVSLKIDLCGPTQIILKSQMVLTRREEPSRSDQGRGDAWGKSTLGGRSGCLAGLLAGKWVLLSRLLFLVFILFLNFPLFSFTSIVWISLKWKIYILRLLLLKYWFLQPWKLLHTLHSRIVFYLWLFTKTFTYTFWSNLDLTRNNAKDYTTRGRLFCFYKNIGSSFVSTNELTLKCNSCFIYGQSCKWLMHIENLN